MSERDDITTESQARARDAVRALAPAVPDPAFRARLRGQFVAGTITPAAPRVVRGPWAVRPAFWVPLAAAAGFALAFFTINRAPDWQVIATSGTGTVQVGSQVVPAVQREAIAALVRRGGHIRLSDDVSLDLVSPGQIAVSLAPGCDITLPPAPNRIWDRAAHADLAMGDAFFATGPHFHGASLDVTTDEANAHVVGTSFAVLRQPHGTCVCVMEGRVRVNHELTPGDVVEVPAGLRRMCYDDSPSETGPILKYSEHALHHLRAASQAALNR